MNSKSCKRLRNQVDMLFPDLVGRRLIVQKLGHKMVKHITLDEHGKRTEQMVQVPTARIINDPKSKRGVYLRAKRSVQV